MTRLAMFLLLILMPAMASAQAVGMTERREADGSTTLVHEVIVEAPAAEIWTAISTAEGWRTWAVPVAWDSPIEPGTIETSYTAAARPGDPTTIRQRIVALIPGHLLAFRTVKAPDGFPHFETFRQVSGFIELAELDEGRTRVRLTGAGYADSEAGRTLLGFFRAGNRVSLERLARRFAEGPIDWSRER